MKAEISRNSHDPEKRYSGVYQQQGRMLTDADWNELVDILKARLNDALKDVIGSATPRQRKVDILAADEPAGWTIGAGRIYVDGVSAEVSGSSTTVAYTGQRDFPGAPKIGESDYLLYADVWERTVTALEDQQLVDPGLHGADTCARTQTMCQIKWCPDGLDPQAGEQNPAHGNAELTLRLRAGATSSDACDPCADVVAIDEQIGNYLFRVEVHDVQYIDGQPAKGMQSVTLKWSGENGAEQYDVDSVPAAYKDHKWVYEFFDETSEKHLGVHLAGAADFARRGELTEAYPATAPDAFGFVRRWDGYCTVDLKNGKLISGRDRGVTLSTAVDAAKAGFVDIGASLKINLSAMELMLKLSNRRLVAGDYWLAPVREHASDANQLLPDAALPNGIHHHYLTLAKIGGEEIELVSGDDCRRHGFPPLSDIRAEDICVEALCSNLYGDAKTVQQALENLCDIDAADIAYEHECEKGANEKHSSVYDDATSVKDVLDNLCDLHASDIAFTPDCVTLSETGNVQEALSALCARDLGNCCARTVGKGGYYPNLTIAFEDIREEKEVALCLLPGDHEIKVEPDLPMLKVLKMSGAGTDASRVTIVPGAIDLIADVLILRDISFLINRKTGTMTLTTSQLDVQSCSFERLNAGKNAGSVVKVVAKDDKATIQWQNNYVVSLWKQRVFDLGQVFGAGPALPPALRKAIEALAVSDPLADEPAYSKALTEVANGIAGMSFDDRVKFSGELNKQVEKLPGDTSYSIRTGKRLSLSAAATKAGIAGARARVIKPYSAGAPSQIMENAAVTVGVRNPDVANIRTGIDELVRTATTMGYGDCLGIARHLVSGVIRSSQFDGNIVLNADLTNAVDLGAQNPIKRVHPDLEMPLYPGQLDGSLHITGNRCQRLITLLPLSTVNATSGMLGPHGDEYQTLFVSENVLSGIQNSLIAGTLHFQGNQFTDDGEGELMFVISVFGMYTGNGATTEGRVINTILSRNREAANWLTLS
ncbi:MAG: hypothetical protein AUJ57_06550 [Zetaproteobacteria bacterium CG1_02_53_45]|nr:MAG: hypothetical protein AUJ57_06550 [Zetaproteobacteria bacterium CG1_02_53_45]